METSLVLYSLVAFFVVVVVLLGAYAAWTRLPPPPTPDSVRELRSDFEQLSVQFAQLADAYEISLKRNAAKIGSLRKKLAEERNEDFEESAETDQPLPLSGGHKAQSSTTLSKAELWAKFGRKTGMPGGFEQ